MTDPDLSALLRAGSPACPAGGRDCPDADTFVALAAGTLDPARRDAVLDRVATCADCATALRVAIDAASFARDLARDAAAPAIVTPLPAPRRRRPPAVFALAASVLVAVGASSLLLRAPTPDAVRGTTVAAVEPADGARLDRAPQRLAWACSAPAAVTIELLDATGTQVWSGPTTACAIDLPAEARATLAAGDWLWLVRANNGAQLAGPWRFRID
jgi:hypothetical protein